MSDRPGFHNRPYAELSGGVITGSSHPSRLGKIWFFIDWDGPSYDDACDALDEWREDGVRTVDLLREALL